VANGDVKPNRRCGSSTEYHNTIVGEGMMTVVYGFIVGAFSIIAGHLAKGIKPEDRTQHTKTWLPHIIWQVKVLQQQEGTSSQSELVSSRHLQNGA
jgi:hypothetical protein